MTFTITPNPELNRWEAYWGDTLYAISGTREHLDYVITQAQKGHDMRPERLKKIRARHEQALTNLQHGRTPTAHETLALIGDLTDLLNDVTNSIRPPLDKEI